MYELPGNLFLLILSLLFLIGVREVWVAHYVGHPVLYMYRWRRLKYLRWLHVPAWQVEKTQPLGPKN